MTNTPRIFISYSHSDLILKNNLEKLLQDKGLIVLSDSKNRAGKELHKEISSLLNQSHFVIPIITKNWLQSIESRDEFVRAHERRKIIICLLNSDDEIDEKNLPFFVKEDLRIHFNSINITEKFEYVYQEIENTNFVDFWKNQCYDEIRKIGDLIQNNNHLLSYKSSHFEKKIKKLHDDLTNVLNDNYETNVSYEENFLRDASPYFKHASKIYAVSIVNVSTFWTDRKARNAAIAYLEAQGDPSKHVIRLFVFESPRQVHIFKRILLRNYNYYVQQKQNNFDLMSSVLVCSRKVYEKMINDIMQYDPVMGSNIYEQDFGILTYGTDSNSHILEASLNSTNFKVKKIRLQDEISRRKFIEFMEEITRVKSENYSLKTYGIAKMYPQIFEDEHKWNSMIEDIFEGQSKADIFHVVYFNVRPTLIIKFEEIISEFIATVEIKKKEMKIKAISLRKFKKINNARDHQTNGDLNIQRSFNYALNVIFADQGSLELYYQDQYHSEVREKLYVLLNPETRREFRRIKNNRLNEFEKQLIFKDIESMMNSLILRVDWEQYDTKNSITPAPL